MKRPFTLYVLAAACLLNSCRQSPPSNMAASVNGRPITYDDLEKAYKIQFPTPPTPAMQASEDSMTVGKIEVLRSLIDNEIMLQRAEKLGLIAVASDVEARFNEVKAPYTQEEFQRQLAARRLTADEFKAQLRKDLSIAKLWNKEITSRISITDKDVSDFYNANKAGYNFAEPQVHLAQILVTPNPDPNVRNLKGDKAQNEEHAKKKIEMLEGRLKQGEDFAMLAQNYSEDPYTSPNGGDLGYVPESSLEKAHVDIRKLVMAMQAGQVSPILRTPEGYRMLKVISKEPAGQRDLNDPRVQQEIRGTLLNRKDQLLRASYYEVARNEAQVVNHFAASVLDNTASKVK